MTSVGSERTTIGVSFLRRVGPLLLCLSFLALGISTFVSAEVLSRTRGKPPIWLFESLGTVISLTMLYCLYRLIKIFRMDMPRLEIGPNEISIYYSAIKFENYAWKEIESFFSAKRPSVFELNNDCVALRLKHPPNGVDFIELPAGLDQNASRLADFLNSQRLKFGSEQNQKNG